MTYAPRVQIYRGPSVLNPSVEIIAFVSTAPGNNKKTGNLTTMYILPSELFFGDRHITSSLLTAETSKAVCGDCPLRPKHVGGNGQCYAHSAPLQYGCEAARKAPLHMRGPVPSPILRSAGFGDSAAIPADVFLRFQSRFQSVRGYTQQWRWADHLKDTHMASVHSTEEALLARSMGWRTFRDRQPADPRLSWEVECVSPATTCERCTLCSGNTRATAPSVTIIDHGPLVVARKRKLKEAA